MEAIIYIKGVTLPLKKVICKRDNGKYIVESLQYESFSNTYYYSKVSKFEEIKEFQYNNALKKEKEVIDYINNKIVELDNIIIDKNNELRKTYRSKDSLSEISKIEQIKGEIDSNKKFLDSMEGKILTEEEKTQVDRISKNKKQLEKAIKRLNSRISKKEKEVESDIKEDIRREDEKIRIYNQQLRYIKTLKKKESDNDFFK